MPTANQLQSACLVDAPSGRILAISAQLAQRLGWKPGEIQDRRLADLVPAAAEQPQAGQLLRIANGDGDTEPIVFTAISNEEGLLKFDSEVTVTRMIAPSVDQLLVLFRPLTQSAAGTLHRDALTGLADRSELGPHREHWRQTSSEQAVPHAVLFLDLDGFKQVNDQFGHAVGDRVLQALAPRWKGCIREGDLLARYGGDEFVVLLRGVANREEVGPIVERLIQATREPICLDSQSLQVFASIGIALAKDISCDLQRLLDEADRDMYAAKERKC